ncbi:protein-(glutamine-N5) methyltransferase, release factor-specific [Humibacillus sp. DSM 29435]|uniref:peptide chain release factor N(5)-glutamine methyltransferase n=1 Tax=Humibacillus sp. DSM 29435 TaxID=1869167 RepID=UPI0008731B90|nr:peptide chain release factor N(5)-glutamine methyltransferase [Humibacillus sp. DSM 29435]OFE14639.1 protein-(glutamine-N5) methyltransferase, release factor-specific [Humibacillus sp. DSM 29435]
MTGATDLATGVRAAVERLTRAGIRSAEVDAVELAAHTLGVEAAELRRLMVLGGRTLPESFAALVDDRARRIPLQHLTGRAYFRYLTLAVGPGVFVPRPETEVLVDLALAEIDHLISANDAFEVERGGLPRRSTSNESFAGKGGASVRVVDLCSGSGAIALAIKAERPDAVVRGVEVSAEACAWAVSNRDRLGLDVEIVHGDATKPCLLDWAGMVDVVTVNPPYIPLGAVPNDPEVRDHDPQIALYGGSDDGLAIPLQTVAVAVGLLRAGGLLLVEHADVQGESLPRRMRQSGAWSAVADHDDLTGRPRVTSARRADTPTP